MAISTVPLNIDPRGYAGGILRGVNVPGGGGGGGMLPGIGDFLNRIMSSRQALAKAQLRLMEEELVGARERRYAERSARRKANVPDSGLHAADPQKQLGSMLIQNLRRAEGQPLNLEDWARKGSARGMAGLIGGIMSGQTGHTNIMPYTPQPGFTPPPEGPRYSGVGPNLPGYYFGAGAPATGRGALTAAQRRTGKPVKGGSYSIGGGFRRGGTVPKTGTYKLHRGELVMSPEDVEQNPDMVAQLIRQKLTERVGKVRGSYQGGTVQEELIDRAFEGDMASFREVLRGAGVAEPEIDRVVNQVTRNRGRIIPKATKIQNIKDYFRGTLAPYAGGPGVWEGERLATELEGGPKLLSGQELLGPGRVIEGLPPPTPIPGPTSARLAEAAGTAAKVGAEAIPPAALEDAIRASRGRGGKIAAGVGIPAALAALYMAARQSPSTAAAPKGGGSGGAVAPRSDSWGDPRSDGHENRPDGGWRGDRRSHPRADLRSQPPGDG